MSGEGGVSGRGGMEWDEEESGGGRGGGTFHPPSPPSTFRRTVFSRNPFQFFPSTHPPTHSAPKWMSLTPPEDLSLTARQMRLVPGFGDAVTLGPLGTGNHRLASG